jgi:hypothetical protein
MRNDAKIKQHSFRFFGFEAKYWKSEEKQKQMKRKKLSEKKQSETKRTEPKNW